MNLPKVYPPRYNPVVASADVVVIYSNATTLIAWSTLFLKAHNKTVIKLVCNLSYHIYKICCVYLGLDFDVVMAGMTCSCFWPNSQNHASQKTYGNNKCLTHSRCFHIICIECCSKAEHRHKNIEA